MPSPLLQPVIALVLWSFVMLAWLYAMRIPVVVRQKIKFDPKRPNEEFFALMPPEARSKADNYNHLMEQPTLFYAVALALVLIGADGSLNVMLAWSYVTLRVVHSLVQAMANIVLLRFAIFILSSLVLLALSLRAAVAVF